MDSSLDRYREKVSSGGAYIAIGIGQKTKEKGHLLGAVNHCSFAILKNSYDTKQTYNTGTSPRKARRRNTKICKNMLCTLTTGHLGSNPTGQIPQHNKQRGTRCRQLLTLGLRHCAQALQSHQRCSSPSSASPHHVHREL